MKLDPNLLPSKHERIDPIKDWEIIPLEVSKHLNAVDYEKYFGNPSDIQFNENDRYYYTVPGYLKNSEEIEEYLKKGPNPDYIIKGSGYQFNPHLTSKLCQLEIQKWGRDVKIENIELRRHLPRSSSPVSAKPNSEEYVYFISQGSKLDVVFLEDHKFQMSPNKHMYRLSCWIPHQFINSSDQTLYSFVVEAY